MGQRLATMIMMDLMISTLLFFTAEVCYTEIMVSSTSSYGHVKARLHLQFLLRFLVQFSSSDACE